MVPKEFKLATTVEEEEQEDAVQPPINIQVNNSQDADQASQVHNQGSPDENQTAELNEDNTPNSNIENASNRNNENMSNMRSAASTYVRSRVSGK